MTRFIKLVSIILLSIPILVNAQEISPPLFGVIGTDYSVLFKEISSRVSDYQENNTLNILVFPITLASNANSISDAERSRLIKITENELTKIQNECQSTLHEEIKCLIKFLPVFTRADAENFNLNEFPVAKGQIAIILDGDPKVGMETIINTQIERMLEEIQNLNGIVLGGNMMSKQMIAGFNERFSAKNSLGFESPELWNSNADRGLNFGIDNTLIETHLFDRGLFGRLISAVINPATADLGIGTADSRTGFLAYNNHTIRNIDDDTPLIIIDSTTYHTSEYADFIGPKNYPSLRNLLIHTLADSDYYFDLERKVHSIGEAKPFLFRSDTDFNLGDSEGNLIIGGDLEFTNNFNPILRRFINISGGINSNILLLAAGFEDEKSAKGAAQEYIDSSGVPVNFKWIPPGSLTPIGIEDDVTGIILIASDPSTVDLKSLEAIKNNWLTGTPVFTDGEASRLVGKSFINDTTATDNSTVSQVKTTINFDQNEILQGLNLTNLNFEIQLNSENRWQRFLNLAQFENKTITLGIDKDSALEFSNFGVLALGENPVVSLDFRDAQMVKNELNQIDSANGFIDIFVPGEMLIYKDANMDELPLPGATPIISTQISTSESPSPIPLNYPEITPKPGFPVIIVITQQVEVELKPTPTPIEVPPPADPNWSRMMISVVIISVIIVITGVWINRR